MVAPIEPVNIAENSAAAHQSLADRIFSVFHGAEQYVIQHLPEHHLKDAVLSDIKQGYDHAVAVIKGDLAATQQAAVSAAETAVSDVAPVLEHTAEDVTSSLTQTAETVAADVQNVTRTSDPAAPSEAATDPSQGTESASAVSEGSAPESAPQTVVSDTPAAS